MNSKSILFTAVAVLACAAAGDNNPPADADAAKLQNRLEALEARVKMLEAKVEKLESNQHLPQIIEPSPKPGFPALPPGPNPSLPQPPGVIWGTRQFNGMTYYLIPCTNPQPSVGR